MDFLFYAASMENKAEESFLDIAKISEFGGFGFGSWR
jgi:hypothetical protein